MADRGLDGTEYMAIATGTVHTMYGYVCSAHTNTDTQVCNTMYVCTCTPGVRRVRIQIVI